MKKYKAIVLDVDGTLILNDPDAFPSEAVKEAIRKAQSYMHVGVASGRPLFLLKKIFSALKLTGPAIILGGAQVIDCETYEVLWEKGIEQEDVERILKIYSKHNISLFYDQEYGEVEITKESIPEKAFSLYTGKKSIPRDVAESVIEDLSEMKNIQPHILEGWGGGAAINITHAAATKQHGIFELSKILGIDPREIIAVGDGANDFPLLMSCGLKVAMGNASDDLKAIADYVAPSVVEDGVVEVIEKFVR